VIKTSIKTTRKRQIIDITEILNKLIGQNKMSEGLCSVFVKHTTAALVVCDLDPGYEHDYVAVFEKLLPDISYKHPHDPKHFSDHILSAIMGVSQTIPVSKGSLLMGTWQKVVLMEFNGPRERELCINFLKSGID
jgi:secondary thiamine-phosphate synthase enzyme